MPKKVAILQSNYIPWKGYFDIINSVDLFVFHDDVQYTRQDWRNRNRIKTPGGTKWLTIPCGADETHLISDVALRDHGWQLEHWRRIVGSYRRAPYFDLYAGFLEDVYVGRLWDNLSELNQFLVEHICRAWLHIATPFDDSRNHRLTERKAARVMELLGKVDATEYVSGPAGKDYLEETEFARRGIALTWVTYSGYREYDQLYPPFEHNVSIIDLLVSTGPDASKYMNSFR
jgi:hypothetical protein